MSDRSHIKPNDKLRLREYIRTEMIVDRLQRVFFNQPLEGQTAPVELSDRQITIAFGLLKKSLPDLSSVEISGDTTTRVISADAMDEAAWARHYAEREASETPRPRADGETIQ